MDPKNISEKVANGEAYLIDVRTGSEFNEEHAKGAILWDVTEHMSAQTLLPEIDKGKEVYTYCRSGARSGHAKMIFEANGFTNVTNIGGLIDWISAGGETE